MLVIVEKLYIYIMMVKIYAFVKIVYVHDFFHSVINMLWVIGLSTNVGQSMEKNLCHIIVKFFES